MSSRAASSSGAVVAAAASGALHSSPSTDMINGALLVQSTHTGRADAAAAATTGASGSDSAAAAAAASRSSSSSSLLAAPLARPAVADYKGGGSASESNDAVVPSTAASSSVGSSSRPPAAGAAGAARRCGTRAQTREELRAAFSVFDPTSRGRITSSEFAVVFKMLGYASVSDAEVEEIIQQLDSDGDKNISFDEFCNVMTRRAAAERAEGGSGGAGSDLLLDPLDDALSVFDSGDPRLSRLPLDELWHICGLLKENLSEEEKECLVKELVDTTDGCINYAKLVQQMMPGGI